MSPVNLENFVQNLLMDSSEAGDPVPDRPGWVQLPDSPLDPEYRQVRAYTEEVYMSNNAALDPSEHGGAYDIAMLTLLHLRKYWIETSEWAEEKRPEAALGSMSEDIQKVIEHLVTVRNALRVMEKGENTLEGEVKLKEAALSQAKLLFQKVKSAEAEAAAAFNISVWLRDSFRVLNEGPVEQLARVGQDSTINNTKEGA